MQDPDSSKWTCFYNEASCLGTRYIFILKELWQSLRKGPSDLSHKTYFLLPVLITNIATGFYLTQSLFHWDKMSCLSWVCCTLTGINSSENDPTVEFICSGVFTAPWWSGWGLCRLSLSKVDTDSTAISFCCIAMPLFHKTSCNSACRKPLSFWKRGLITTFSIVCTPLLPGKQTLSLKKIPWS